MTQLWHKPGWRESSGKAPGEEQADKRQVKAGEQLEGDFDTAACGGPSLPSAPSSLHYFLRLRPTSPTAPMARTAQAAMLRGSGTALS